MDFTCAFTALVFLSPVLGIVALAVKKKLGSPVVFRQIRPGLHGRPFTIHKFRTMRDTNDATGRPLADVDRLTPLGRFLRATSMDELPELMDVIRGDMSLVGPRPLLVQYLDRYTPEQARRHEVKPGLTGWAQVNGRNAISWEEKFKLDLWYVENHTLWVDLKILLITLGHVVKRQDICAEGHATMPEFFSIDKDSN